MATVRAYSVCQSDVEAGENRRSATVYSYSPSVGLQTDTTLAFADQGNPAGAMRTGLLQTYAASGSATADADGIGYANSGGLTPTLINGNTGGTAATFPAGTGVATNVDNFNAGTGNIQLANCARVICSTTNVSEDDMGAGLQVAVSTNATGVPALIDAPNRIVAGGNGYANGDTDVVALDGFPGCNMTVTVG